MEKIDKLDRQILNIISKNARIPFKDVAEECGVSRAAIHQRVQRMIDMNVIVGSGYHINPKILGYNTCTYIGVKLERGSMYSNKTNHQKALDNPNNKRAIALLKNLVKEDRSLSEMARILNSEGFVTSKGCQFRASQVSILLKRYNLKED